MFNVSGTDHLGAYSEQVPDLAVTLRLVEQALLAGHPITVEPVQ